MKHWTRTRRKLYEADCEAIERACLQAAFGALAGIAAALAALTLLPGSGY